jgi:hypothetical protein
MRPSLALEHNRAAIREIVLQNNCRNPRVFGSVLRDEDTEDSDLDILVEPLPGATLFDIGAILGQLKELLNVQVDVLTPNALPDSFRSKILIEATLI